MRRRIGMMGSGRRTMAVMIMMTMTTATTTMMMMMMTLLSSLTMRLPDVLYKLPDSFKDRYGVILLLNVKKRQLYAILLLFVTVTDSLFIWIILNSELDSQRCLHGGFVSCPIRCIYIFLSVNRFVQIYVSQYIFCLSIYILSIYILFPDDCRYNISKQFEQNELECDCPNACKYVDMYLVPYYVALPIVHDHFSPIKARYVLPYFLHAL